jgi:hypothetical protein
MIDLAFGGIFTDAISSAVAVVLGFTGIFGGAARYGATLAGRSKPEVERATALGFFVGIAFGVFVLVIDAVA